MRLRLARRMPHVVTGLALVLLGVGVATTLPPLALRWLVIWLGAWAGAHVLLELVLRRKMRALQAEAGAVRCRACGRMTVAFEALGFCWRCGALPAPKPGEHA